MSASHAREWGNAVVSSGRLESRGLEIPQSTSSRGAKRRTAFGSN